MLNLGKVTFEGWEQEYLLIQDVSELPPLPEKINNAYVDFETQSWTKERGGLKPYNGDRICGIAVSWDDWSKIYYIPIRHTTEAWNVDLRSALEFLKTLLERAKHWINANVLFDSHFARVDGIDYLGELIDVQVLAKLHDSDRWDYDLKPLCDEWIQIPRGDENKRISFLAGIKSKNYADCPADILGEYACGDVFRVRSLYSWLMKHKQGGEPIRGIECLLTSALYDIEKVGLAVNKKELQLELKASLTKMIKIWDELTELVGYEVNPKSRDDVCDLLINNYGCPVLSWKDDDDLPEDPAERNQLEDSKFDKAALALYSMHPTITCDEKRKRVVDLIIEYRKEAQYKGLFVEPYIEKNADGILHSSYNQVVRTGRMSCRNPNAQQLNKRAKALIHPLPGYAFLSCDYSQIEFRLIVHYINDVEAIEAYRNNPKTDFHTWVAELCGVHRKQAKNLNFAMGYGAGKAKVIRMLVSDPTLMESISKQMHDEIKAGKFTTSFTPTREMLMQLKMDKYENWQQVQMNPPSYVINEEYKMRCETKANDIYATYHERLPGIRTMSRFATQKAKERGFVFTGAGRRRHFQPKFTYKAFNSVVQGFAADLMKERLVSLSPRYNKWMRDHDISIVCNVHDEALFMGPIEVMRQWDNCYYIAWLLRQTPFDLKIPILTSCGYSETSWADAGLEDKCKIDVETGRFLAGPLEVPDDWTPDRIGQDPKEYTGLLVAA